MAHEIHLLTHAPQKTIADHRGHRVLFEGGENELLLPFERLHAQARIVVFVSRTLLDAVDAVVLLRFMTTCVARRFSRFWRAARSSITRRNTSIEAWMSVS